MKSSKKVQNKPTSSTQAPISRFRPHPWHGLDVGVKAPEVVNAFIEITPFDLVKYEVDKVSGYLQVDRPQRSSSQPPTLYGFIPKTYCGEQTRRLSPKTLKGDGDPLDICVLSEREITHGEVIVRAKVVGGLQMVDRGEADDKIIAVLENDFLWGTAEDIKDLPPVLVERLEHYFLTYKWIPGQPVKTHIEKVYGKSHALRVVKAAMRDYSEKFPDPPV